MRQLHDPNWFVPKLGIITDQGAKRSLHPLHPEQAAIVDTLHNNRNTLVLKPRQIGCTTIVMAYVFWLLYTSGDPLSALTITHESGAVGRVNQMCRHYWQTLPLALSPGVNTPDNAKAFGLPHNQSVFRQLMAGGRGQARSWTYQVLWATEMALWPKGSAVMSGANLDRDVWASAMSTLHAGPNTKVIIESTGNGPTGVFYDMVKVAMKSDDWAFLFFPWTEFLEYRRPPPKGFQQTEEEHELVKQFGLSDEQLCWRRYKLFVEGYEPDRFRKEYPLTWFDPFLQAGGLWFDGENLNRIAASVPVSKQSKRKRLHVYEAPSEQTQYFIGMDTSGGTGRDWSVIMVLSDDLRQVAVWRCNNAKPREQADAACELSNMYGRARILCEKNNYGEAVIKRMAAQGARLWKDINGKDFWTQGGRAGRTKKMIYDWAAHLVDGNFVEFHDATTVEELTTIKEQDGGNIEADGDGHDDHADALCLALWNARRQFDKKEKKPESIHKQRLRRMRETGMTV